LLSVTATSTARAGQGESGAIAFDRTAAARALFQEGLVHADAGRWPDAANRFERAQALRASPEIAYNLSTALTQLGRLVRASELLREIGTDPHAAASVKQAAARRLAALLPRLAHLTVQAPPAGEQVLLDGRRLDPVGLGVALPIDPGPHTVELRQGTATVLTRGITLAEGQRRSVSLDRLAPTLSSPSFADRSQAVGARKPLFRRTWPWMVLGGLALGTTVALVAIRDPAAPRGNVDTWTLGGQ
jgi:hypothetical protein